VPHHAVRKSGDVVGPLLALVAFTNELFFYSSSIFQKKIGKKIGVLESQKHAKIRKYASQC
jgi:hypothetical protein